VNIPLQYLNQIHGEVLNLFNLIAIKHIPIHLKNTHDLSHLTLIYVLFTHVVLGFDDESYDFLTVRL